MWIVEYFSPHLREWLTIGRYFTEDEAKAQMYQEKGFTLALNKVFSYRVREVDHSPEW